MKTLLSLRLNLLKTSEVKSVIASKGKRAIGSHLLKVSIGAKG